LWTAEGVGDGYSQPIYANGVVYITGDIGDDLVLSALDASDDSLPNDQRWLWHRRLEGEAWRDRWPGTRSTPTYDAASNRLYLLTAHGTLSARNAADGEEIWSRRMSEWDGRRGGWGYAESPLVTDELVIVTPGGANTMVALDKDTGEEVWRTAGVNMPAHYASAILAQVGSRTLVINGTGGGLLGVDVATGEVAFTNAFSSGGRVNNCTTPVFDAESGLLFWANGYGQGGITLRLSERHGAIVAEEMNRFPNALVQHGGYVLVNGHVYGSNESSLLCLDPAAGETKWTTRSVGKGSIHFADGRLYCFSENGTVVLVEPSPDGFLERGRFRVPGERHSWTAPVVANRRLLLRYGPHSDVLYAFDVAAR
jgi:outer membrane protein assembly factor BamB